MTTKRKEIREKSRPRCPICSRSMYLCLTEVGEEEIWGWNFGCECVKESKLTPDHIFKFPNT